MATEKGDCFEAHGQIVLRARTAGFLLCHGTVEGTGGEVEGQRYDHAWIEVNGMVIDQSNGRNCSCTKRKYYEIGKVKDVKRYTSEEVAKKTFETENWGPWDE